MSQYEVYCEFGERYLGIKWMWPDDAKELRTKNGMVVILR